LVAVKHLENGESDNSFGVNGTSIVDLGEHFIAAGLAIQKDRKVLVAGFTDRPPSEGNDFVGVRLMANGSRDADFGKNGVVTLDLSTTGTTSVFEDRAHSILVQADGKIVIGGISDEYRPGETRALTSVALVRLNAQGSIDTSYGVQGVSKI
jgi:uncharacterized delta-60 repeat protein